MEIIVKNLQKAFNEHNVINKIDFHFQSKMHYGIKGNDGSGKSTLIKLLAGYLSPGSGTITYKLGQHEVSRNQIYQYIAIAAPYSSLIHDFSLKENFQFFRKFKKTIDLFDYKSILEILEWKNPHDKLYSNFSSGMQQKANLLFALISNTPILFLDEPTSFLDEDAKKWYIHNFNKYAKDKIVIIASNDDVDFCDVTTFIYL